MNEQDKQSLSAKQIRDSAFERAIYAVELLEKGTMEIQSDDPFVKMKCQIGMETLKMVINMIQFIQKEENSYA